MANKNPLKYDISQTYRVDQAFVDAVERLRKLSPVNPTKSDIVREAVFEKLAREERKADRKK